MLKVELKLLEKAAFHHRHGLARRTDALDALVKELELECNVEK